MHIEGAEIRWTLTHEENGYQRSHLVENEEDQPSRRPPKEAKITRVEGRKVPRTHAEEDDVRW